MAADMVVQLDRQPEFFPDLCEVAIGNLVAYVIEKPWGEALMFAEGLIP